MFTCGVGSTTATLASASSTLVPASIRDRIGTRVPVVGVVLTLCLWPPQAPSASASAATAVIASARRATDGCELVIVSIGMRVPGIIVS